MRRDPAKCDAYERFEEGCAEAAGCAAVSFERLWQASEALVHRTQLTGGSARPAKPPVIEAQPQPTVGTRH
jgi:hypothetical protein